MAETEVKEPELLAIEIVQIFNRHTQHCGTPPHISNADEKLYVGYFENRHGEQFIFTFNRETKEGRLRAGDLEWPNEYAVIDGKIEMILSEEEQEWLTRCWKTAHAG